MANQQEKGSFRSFSRGAELWKHQIRLMVVSLVTVTFFSAFIGVMVGAMYLWGSASGNEVWAIENNASARFWKFVTMNDNKMEIVLDGVKSKVSRDEVIELTDGMLSDMGRKLKNTMLLAGLSFIGSFVLIAFFWMHYGGRRLNDERIRGAQLTDGAGLKSLLKKRKDASVYEIAQVPMRKGSETLHTLFVGAQGTGKSQEMFSMMKQVRAQGKRMIVYDPTGEFTAAFYREGVDVLLNPMDARSVRWNVWAEIAKDYHFDNVASGLIPDPAESDPFWALAGRMVLKDVIDVLGREGRRTNKDLYNSIALSNLDEMYLLLKGKAGATFVDPKTERTGMSLKMTVQNQLEAFRFLHDEGDEVFSIRNWIKNDSDTWLFITARENMREALKPVLSLWIDVAIKAVLDLEPIHRERLWFALDELPTLQKLDVLKLALTNTRKYGLCMLLGMQDFAQLHAIYGDQEAKTIISGCQTKLILRVTDGAAAKQLSEAIAQVEIGEKDVTESYGLQAQRDGVSVNSRRQMRDLVLSAEILRLPDMQGYLVIPGDYPIAKVKYGYRPAPRIAEGFIERNVYNVMFDGHSPSAASSPRKPSDPTPSSSATVAANSTAQSKVVASDVFDLDQHPSTSGSLLDELDSDQHEAITRNERGDVISLDTGEILATAEEVSRAKNSASSSLAGALD